MITLFYDSYCPLCVEEMDQLRKYDQDCQLNLVDIHQQNFTEHYPHIDVNAADRILHAQLTDGTLLYGLDATYAVWKTVGKHRWLGALRWPVIRWFADYSYLFFAKHRYTISRLLTGQERCESCERGVCRKD